MLLFVALLLAGSAHAQWDPNNDPDKWTVVHLFEWKWDDIAAECENFLSKHGYAAVQVSPPQECIIAANRPWWERYQPVSYKINGRSGDEQAFKSMVDRCNAVGVRIYADVVFNHMTGGGSGQGTAGSHYDTDGEQYPGVPYGPNDFNDARCHSSDGNINNYQDPNEVRFCRLVGLRDLNQGSDYVRGKIKDYLNHLSSLGVAGFRVDGAKHMWPQDLKAIFDGVNLSRDPRHGFNLTRSNGRPFIVQEVIDLGGEPITNAQYVGNGRVTEFHYGAKLKQLFHKEDKLCYTKNWGEGWGFMKDNNALVFVDDHDTQRNGQAMTYKESRNYKMAVTFMLAQPYGYARVMSSYSFDNKDQGPPNDGSGNIVGPTFDGDVCGGGWVCEHRWRQIYNMAEFRAVAHGEPVGSWWDNQSQQIAFCRGSKAFFALNNEGSDMNQQLQTCLPEGSYCDVISGNKVGGSCGGKTITVGGDGTASISIGGGDKDPMVAIHINSKL